MAEKKILIDDISGNPIEDEGEAVQIIVKPKDSKKGQWVLDTTMSTSLVAQEVEHLAKLGRHQGAAGRRATKTK